ncbi:MAG: hypothetical protein LWY06_09575 [Firmicutes bacterium]|nr:hypothetical protein [Bacillota bacterium]
MENKKAISYPAGKLMQKLLCFAAAFVFCITPAFAALPNLPKQELMVKIVSLIVGVGVVFAISILLISRLLLWTIRLEADLATNLSIVIAVVLSFLWFLYLFGQIFDMIMKIVIGVFILVGILMFFLREKTDKPTSSNSDDIDINY